MAGPASVGIAPGAEHRARHGCRKLSVRLRGRSQGPAGEGRQRGLTIPVGLGVGSALLTAGVHGCFAFMLGVGAALGVERHKHCAQGVCLRGCFGSAGGRGVGIRLRRGLIRLGSRDLLVEHLTFLLLAPPRQRPASASRRPPPRSRRPATPGTGAARRSSCCNCRARPCRTIRPRSVSSGAAGTASSVSAG